MEKPLRERLTPALIEALKTRTKSNDEVAALLGVHPRYLSMVFNKLAKRNRGKVVKEREENAELVAARRELRIREAKKVKNGTKTLAKAAKAARCSERTMRRYIEQVAPLEPTQAYE